MKALRRAALEESIFMHEPLYPTDNHPFVDAHGAVRLVSKLEQIVPLMEDSQHAVVCSAVMGLAYSCLVDPFERAKRQVHPPPAVGVHNERLPFSDGAAHQDRDSQRQDPRAE